MADSKRNLREMSKMLLPCPFCGGNARLACYIENDEWQIVAECENYMCLSAACGAQTPEDAIKRWNKRVKSTRLKECPFCGDHVELEHYYDFDREYEKYQVRCPNPECRAETVSSLDAEDVIRMWNRRANEEGDSE